jgi:hypothetical protein
MKPTNHWIGRSMRLMLPLAPLVLALPGHAQAATCTGTSSTSACFTDPAGLADTSEPGSVIVYQKFQQGAVIADAGTGSATIQPRSLIELGAVCPNDSLCGSTGELVIRVEFHWVVPPQPDNAGVKFASSGICQENNWFVNLTLDGKVWFDPDGPVTPLDSHSGGGTVADPLGGVVHGDPNPAGLTQIVPQAPGVRGYLLGWVVNIGVNVGGGVVWNNPRDTPTKFDGLIGDAVMRNTPQDLQAYKALTIQADPRLGEGELIDTAQNSKGHLVLPFDGLAEDYQEVTGQLSGDVVYNSDLTAPFADTSLILLTLDVASNASNSPTFVNLDFFRPDQTPVSESLAFTCWGQVNLTTIDPSLTREIMGERGLVITSQAFNSAQSAKTCPDSTAGCVTMLGLVQVTEGPTPGPANATRSYTVPVFNNSIPIPTIFTATQ